MVQTIEGTSVYKARVLWSNFEPDALFDDRVICMPQVLGKNSEGASTTNSNIDIDSLLMSQAESQMAQTQSVKNDESHVEIISKLINDISVYPNPATEYITVHYSIAEDGQFVLYNTIGEKVLTSVILKTATRKQINLDNLTNGIYQYEIVLNNGVKSRGKLTIKK